MSSPLHGAGLQNVRYRAPLEIDDKGPVSEAFAPAPVVDRNGAQRFGLTLFPDMALQLPQDGVVADRHSQARQQPFADPAAGGMAEQSSEFANSPCSPGRRQRDRQRFGECLSSTARCDISSGQSESPASQEPPELEAPAAVASANCAATRKLPRSPDTIDFPYPPLIRPSGFHGTPRLAR